MRHSTATATDGRRDLARLLLILAVPIAIMAMASFAAPVLNDGDTFWHIAAGRWIIAHREVPSVDPFSFTFAGRPWFAHEWLSELLLALAFRLAGWGAVMLLVGLCIGAVAAIMARWLSSWLAPLSTVVALVLGLGCVAPSLLARPQIICLPALALWSVALLEARRRGRAPGLGLAPLMALWANLHSSFIVGLGLVGVFALEAALDAPGRRWRTLLAWGGFGAAALAAALVTPHGVEGLLFPLRVIGMKTLPSITEWRGPDFTRLEPMEIALLGGAFALFWRGARLGAVRAALLLLLVHLTLQHVRQELLLGVIAPLVVAEPLGRALGTAPAPSWRPLSPRLRPLAALAGVLLAGVVAARLTMPMRRADAATAPVNALAHVPAALRRQPVLNDYDFGGYLIFEGVAPYIDGRADMYGDAFVADDTRIESADPAALARAVRDYHIGWAILAPRRPLVGALAADAGWRRLYADRFAVVFEKLP
ncbi:MAG TPA: hypothetical protein VMU93_03160 [Caulobacteraceae bacterium]|nr:hypothetical protein [Caulobacteraceae bacterium]